MPDTVEVMHDRTIETFAAFLAARQGYYDVIWIARTHNLDRAQPLLERFVTDGRPRIVLDTEAIAAQRDAGRSALTDAAPAEVEAAMRLELANAPFCQSIVAVSPLEAQQLRDAGVGNVALIGRWCEVRPRRAPSSIGPACCSSVRCISPTVQTAMRWTGSCGRFYRWWNSRWAGRRG